MVVKQKLMKLKIKLMLIIIIILKEFKKLTSENVSARLAQTNLARKDDIANFIKRQNLMIN